MQTIHIPVYFCWENDMIIEIYKSLPKRGENEPPSKK